MKVGYVNLYQNMILFDAFSSTSHPDYSSNSLNKLIGRRMNHSFGGNGNIMNSSLRSTVKTPGSATSLYTGKSQLIHASNPNPQAGEHVHPRFNQTMYDSFMGKDSGLKIRDRSTKNGERLPFPFVSGLIGGHSYTKPGKKVFFNKRLDNKDVLQHQLEQINYKQMKTKNDHDNDRSQDNELLKTIKENMNKEEFKKRQFNDIFKTHYKLYNDNKRIENENIKKFQLESKNDEKYNFFPYTHGDEIEKKRIEQKDLLTEEVREKYSKANSLVTPSAHQRFNHSFTNGMYPGSSSPGQTLSSEFTGMKALNGKLPVRYVTGYPAFLTPFKQYPYRRLNDNHVEQAMQGAIKRFEEDIKAKEKEKHEDADRFKKQLQENNHYMEELEIKKKKAQVENKRMLLEQMKIENFKRLKESLKDKEKVNTNFGPEENEQTIMERSEFVKKNVGNIKEELEKQMFEKYQTIENERVQERMEDLENLANSKLIMMKEREELLNKDKTAKNVYKDAWKEQMKMKEISKKTEALFKN